MKRMPIHSLSGILISFHIIFTNNATTHINQRRSGLGGFSNVSLFLTGYAHNISTLFLSQLAQLKLSLLFLLAYCNLVFVSFQFSSWKIHTKMCVCTFIPMQCTYTHVKNRKWMSERTVRHSSILNENERKISNPWFADAARFCSWWNIEYRVRHVLCVCMGDPSGVTDL